MAQTWTCPACGTRNAMDAAECQACGRWASIFDLERREDDQRGATYEPARAPEPDPVIVAEPHSSTAERARRVFDTLRQAGGAETDADAETEQRRSGHMARWILVALALLWFVVIPLLDQLA